MKLVLNKSMINALYDSSIQNFHILKATLNIKGDVPKREDLTTGRRIQGDCYTIEVTEHEVILEIPDEFFTDFMKMQSTAIPLFAPVIGSALGAMKVYGGARKVFYEKWFPKKAEAEAKRANYEAGLSQAREDFIATRADLEAKLKEAEAIKNAVVSGAISHDEGMAKLGNLQTEALKSMESAHDNGVIARTVEAQEGVVHCEMTILWAEMDEDATRTRELAVPVNYNADNPAEKVLFVRKNGDRIINAVTVVAKEFVDFVQHGCLVMPMQRGAKDVVFCKTSDHKYNIRYAPNGKLGVDLRFEPIEMELALEALLPVPDVEAMNRLNEEQAAVDAKRIEGTGLKLQ